MDDVLSAKAPKIGPVNIIIAADKATPEDINFMMKFGRGLLCITIDKECSKRLDLSLMVQDNTSLHNTNLFKLNLKNITSFLSWKYINPPYNLFKLGLLYSGIHSYFEFPES